MSRNTRLVAVIGAYLCSVLIFTSFSQEAPIQYATDVKYQEWQNVIHAPEGRVDRQVKVVDIGDANVAVGAAPDVLRVPRSNTNCVPLQCRLPEGSYKGHVIYIYIYIHGV